MSAQTVAQTIQLILAPVVMITACSLFLNGLLGRYSSLNNRLRAMARERFDLLRQHNQAAAAPDQFNVERLQELDHQIPELLMRHHHLRDAVFLVYCALVVYIADMFFIAVAALLDESRTATIALLVFLVGTGALFVGAVIAAIDAGRSHSALMYEVRRISGLDPTALEK